MLWWPGLRSRPSSSSVASSKALRALAGITLIAALAVVPGAGAQAPSGIHVVLGATPADATMSPPDVSHLVVHWSRAEPYDPTQSPQVLWSVDGGPERSAPAFLAGLARDTSPVQETGAEPQYAARLAPIPRGGEVTYRISDGASATDPRTVRMVPFEDEAVRLAFLAHVGYAGFDEATQARLPGVPAPAQDVVNATLALAPDLLLLPGNIAMSTSLQPWDITMAILEPLAATVPVMAVPGAADMADDAHQLRERFVLPLSEPGRVARTATYTTLDDATAADDTELLYHAFSAGPAYVVGLSSETLCRPFVPPPPQLNPPDVGVPPCADGQLDAVQPAWLHDVLEDAREDYNATWIVVYMGSGPYVHADDGGNHLVEDVFLPVLEDYGVDVVVYSQEAIYQRSHPLRGGQPQAWAPRDAKAGTGTVYVNTGGGGWSQADPINAPAPSWLAASAQGLHSLTLDVTRDTLRLTAASVPDGLVLDSLTLHKPTSPAYAAAAGPAGQPAPDSRQEATAAPLAALAAVALALALRRQRA